MRSELSEISHQGQRTANAKQYARDTNTEHDGEEDVVRSCSPAATSIC